MRLYRHAALLAGLVAASPALVRAIEEREGIPPLEPETKPRKGKGHQHKREIERRLRQQARAEAKRDRKQQP